MSIGDRRGVVDASVEVLWKEPDAKVLQRLPLRLRAKVDEHFSVTPERLEFSAAGPSEQRITIRANFDSLHVTEAWSTHPGLAVESVEELEPLATYSVQLRFNAEEWGSDDGTAEVIVKSDSKWQLEHRVPVRVAIGH